MERLGFHAAGFAHALGGASRRGGKRDIAMHAQELDDTFDDGRFSRAGTAGDDGHAMRNGGFDGLPLLGMEGKTLDALQLVNLRGQIGSHAVGHGVNHFAESARDLAFRAIGRGEIERDDFFTAITGKNLSGNIVRENQAVNGSVDGVGVAAKQTACGEG